MPIFHECQRCTACCRWPGQVRIDPAEAGRIASHLGVDEHEFIQAYTRLNTARTGLALTERADGACVFLEGNECRVQAVKPQQCRDFPNLWRFPGFEKVCRSIPRHLDEIEYRRRIREATGRDVLPVSVDGEPSSA